MSSAGEAVERRASIVRIVTPYHIISTGTGYLSTVVHVVKELRGVASACSLAFAARSDRSSTDEARARHHQYRLGCEIHSRFTMEHEQPMTLEELMQCANVTRAAGWPGMQADGAPIMFTYATSLKLASTLPGAASLPHSHKWLLGLSAAQHRMPLVVGGWGQKPWNWYGGSSVKIYAGRVWWEHPSSALPKCHRISDYGRLVTGSLSMSIE